MSKSLFALLFIMSFFIAEGFTQDLNSSRSSSNTQEIKVDEVQDSKELLNQSSTKTHKIENLEPKLNVNHSKASTKVESSLKKEAVSLIHDSIPQLTPKED